MAPRRVARFIAISGGS